MRALVLTALLVTLQTCPSDLRAQGTDGQSGPAAIALELPAPGNCPASAMLTCPEKLREYAEAYRALSMARDAYFAQLGQAFGPELWTENVASEQAKVSAPIAALQDGGPFSLLEKSVNAAKTQLPKLRAVNFIAKLGEARTKRQNYVDAVNVWSKDPFGKTNNLDNKAKLDTATSEYYSALTTFYDAAEGYSLFADQVDTVLASVVAVVKQAENDQEAVKALKKVLLGSSALQDYTSKLLAMRQGQLGVLEEAYRVAKAAGEEAARAGADLKQGAPGKTRDDGAIHIIAAIYGQTDYISTAYDRWRAAANEAIDRDLERFRQVLRSSKSGKDPSQAMCDGTSYVKTRCEWIEAPTKYCRHKEFPKNATIDVCTGAAATDYPDTGYVNTARSVVKLNSPPKNCIIAISPDPFCGGPVAWAPTAGRKALIIYQCGSGSRQFAIGSNNQQLYLFCEKS